MQSDIEIDTEASLKQTSSLNPFFPLLSYYVRHTYFIICTSEHIYFLPPQINWSCRLCTSVCPQHQLAEALFLIIVFLLCLQWRWARIAWGEHCIGQWLPKSQSSYIIPKLFLDWWYINQSYLIWTSNYTYIWYI